MQKLNPNYIVGLVDGEGSFTVYVRNLCDSKERRRRVRVEPKFYVKLIEQDKAILYELKEFFGCGNVYFQKDTRQNHKNCYRYEVSNRVDLQDKILPFFKQNELQFDSKRKDFEHFCQLMEMIKEGEHLKSTGLQKMYRIKMKMH
jgi:hypothetical protein